MRTQEKAEIDVKGQQPGWVMKDKFKGGALGFQAWVATERGLDRYGSMGKGRGVNKARHAKHKVICLCREVAESPCVLRGSRVSKICKP